MKTTKVSYQFKKEAPNPMISELATLYTIEFIPEKKLMEELNVSSFKINEWREKGLKRYRDKDKKFFKKSEVNEFIEKLLEPEKEVQHIKLKL